MGAKEAGGSGAPLSTRPSRLASAAAWLAGQFERQRGRVVLWTPAAYGAGAALYLWLRVEPPLWPTLAVTAAVTVGCLGLRRAPIGRMAAAICLLTAFAAGGFAVAKLRTARVGGPVATALGQPVSIEGFVVDVDSPSRSGSRILVAPVRIDGLAPERTPGRVRLTLRAASPPGPGSAIRARALLNPPPGPASPGAYDFARDAYFNGVGGVGYVLGEPTSISLPAPPRRLAAAMGLNSARWSLARRIVAAIGPANGGLAAAMVTGHEAWIGQDQVDAMRASGLAHMISISGLHMAIVGGFVFGLVRLSIAAWPWAALRISGKKLAALAGLVAVLGYFALSGGSPPAERAAVTASVAFLALLLDRRALTLRNLALAALLVITLQPEAVAQPGFQMSFAATAALVALAEAWPRAVREISAPWPIRALQWTAGWLAVSIGASFVAGLATGPFAIQHFNRVSLWGLPANLAVAPISSFLLMPALAVGAALTPFGLGEAPLTLAGWGVAAVLWIAGLAMRTPHAILIVASAPAIALPTAFLGILLLCLWRGPLRWIGLPLALAVNLWPRSPAPDVWIAEGGDAVAVRQGQTALALRPRAKAFGLEFWSRRRALTLDDPGDVARAQAFDCTRLRCARRAGGAYPRVAADWSRAAPDDASLGALCAGADLVVVRAATTFRCPGATITLSGAELARGGAAELWRANGAWRIVWARDLRGRRPWSLSDSGG